MTGVPNRIIAGVSTLTLSLSVAAIARGQDNIYEQASGSRFKAAPKAPDAEADAAAAAASSGPDMIMGIPANTIFFVAAGAIAIFWFTMGGGRKPKVTRH